MDLVQLVRERVQRQPTVDASRMRAALPLRNPLVTYEMAEDGSAHLLAPLDTQGRGVAGALAKWMKLPSTKQIELEPVGAFVWSLCDGKTSFEAIAKKLRDRYKMNRLEAETALAAFLRMLSQRRLITTVARTKKR